MSRFTALRRTTVLIGALACSGLLAAAQQPQAPPPADPIKQLKETRICKGCDLRGADLFGVDLYGAQLQGADLTGAVLNEANLELANLKGAVGADFTGAKTDRRTVCPTGVNGPCK